MVFVALWPKHSKIALKPCLAPGRKDIPPTILQHFMVLNMVLSSGRFIREVMGGFLLVRIIVAIRAIVVVIIVILIIVAIAVVIIIVV